MTVTTSWPSLDAPPAELRGQLSRLTDAELVDLREDLDFRLYQLERAWALLDDLGVPYPGQRAA